MSNPAAGTAARKPPPDQLMTVDDLAELLNQSPWTVYRNFKTAGVPYLKINGSIRFRRSSVDQWLADCERTGHAGAIA
jgi:excisionase family DNA binding protein